MCVEGGVGGWGGGTESRVGEEGVVVSVRKSGEGWGEWGWDDGGYDIGSAG